MAKVALIQTLFGQQGLDMSYFRHDYHYDHLLSIIKIYNTEEMCCYVQPASAIIKNINDWNDGLAEEPHHQVTFYAEYTDTTTCPWISDVSQLKSA